MTDRCSRRDFVTQHMFLGTRSDMDQIVEAIRKIQAHAPEIAKA